MFTIAGMFTITRSSNNDRVTFTKVDVALLAHCFGFGFGIHAPVYDRVIQFVAGERGMCVIMARIIV